MGLNAMIGSEIRQRRESFQIPTAEFAKRIGVSVSAVGRIERGEQKIDLDELPQIAGQFGLSAWYMVLIGETKIDKSR